MTLVLSKVFKSESSQIHLLSILFHKRSSINNLEKQVNTLETRLIVSNLTVLIIKHQAVQCYALFIQKAYWAQWNKSMAKV